MLYKYEDMDAMANGQRPEPWVPSPVTAENLMLHFDEQGTLWVLPDNETIQELSYRTVENYHVCDFDLDVELLADSYFALSLEKKKQRWRGVHIVRMLRNKCHNHKVPGYQEQLQRVGVL